MDELRHMALFTVAFLVILVVVVARQAVVIGDLQEHLQVQQSLATTVAHDNQELYAALSELRWALLETQQNLSREEVRANACVTPPVLLPPTRRISLSDVRLNSQSVVINAADVLPGVIAPTGSMEPLLGNGTIVLEVLPSSARDIFRGDIVIFEYNGERIIHRVIDSGWDEQGWYVITQGDNNPAPDPLRVRYSQIRGLVVGIIY